MDLNWDPPHLVKNKILGHWGRYLCKCALFTRKFKAWRVRDGTRGISNSQKVKWQVGRRPLTWGNLVTEITESDVITLPSSQMLQHSPSGVITVSQKGGSSMHLTSCSLSSPQIWVWQTSVGKNCSAIFTSCPFISTQPSANPKTFIWTQKQTSLHAKLFENKLVLLFHMKLSDAVWLILGCDCLCSNCFICTTAVSLSKATDLQKKHLYNCPKFDIILTTTALVIWLASCNISFK